jgi:glycosyltransferase involved in cell wall biosynthesis/SAM-dependent methyltransferase
MKYNIAFYCQSIPFTDKTCRLEHSLGGSETMLIGMARELAKMGHFVQVFTTFADISHEGEYNGVYFYDLSHFRALLPSVDWDIFISLRMRDIMTAPIKAKARFLWNQDELVDPKGFMSCLWQTDKLFWISEWQKQHYCEKLPELEPFSYVTRNGIDIEFINKAIKRGSATALSTRDVKKDPYKLIYVSRPERGLEPLLQIFPKIRKHCPEVRLYCARYYSMYEPMPNIKAICDRADRQMAMTPGCEYLGNLSKEELYREIASSRLMVYPGVPNFNETGCIAAMEAQQCGTPIICTNRGALQETIANGAGVKIDGDAYSDVYQAIFVQNVLNLLVDDERYDEMVKSGQVHMEKYDYSVIASEWQDFFDDFFEKRFQKHGKRIFENLMRYDDVVAAWHLAKAQGLEEELHQAEGRLYIDEEHDKEEYAKGAVPPSIDKGAGRFAQIIIAVTNEINPETEGLFAQIDQSSLQAVETISQQYTSGKALRILDFACGNGSLAVHLAKSFPNARITGYDFSPELVRIAKQFAKESQVDDRVWIVEGNFRDIEGVFDVIVCGEFLEHCIIYKEVIEKLENHLANDGIMVFTMPCGPFAELLERGKPRATHRGHVLHWEWGDIQAVFGKKKRYNPRALQVGQTKRGNQVGSWLVVYRKSAVAEVSGEIDFQKKIRVTRPFEKLSVCMIARNVAKWIDLCLENVVDIADEIIVATNEPDEDGTVEKLEKWGAQIITLPTLCPGVPSDTPPPGNFSWIRNESIKPATGDWIFWVDTDEILTYPNCIRKYLTDSPYNGFGLRQKHLSVDQQPNHDVPIRIFRNGRGSRFYGCIHEHAEDGMDTPIKPSLEIPECDLAHFGYVTEAQRRFKCSERNFAMLELDYKFFPGRQLTDVLYARDHLNFALWERQRYNDRNTPETERQLWMAVRKYQKGPWYNNPKHLYFKLIFDFYQRALQWLNVGLSFGLQDVRGGQLRFLSLDEFVEYSKKMIDIKKEELEYDYPHLPIAKG